MPQVGDVFVDVLPDLSGFGDALDQGVTQAAEDAGQVANDVISGQLNNVDTSGLTDAMRSAGADGGDAAGQAANETISGQLDNVDTSGLAEALKSGGTDAGDAAGQAASDALAGQLDTIDTSGLTDALTSGGTEAGDAAGTAATDSVANVVEGGGGDTVIAAFGGLGQIAAEAFAAYFGERSVMAAESVEESAKRLEYGLNQIHMPDLLKPLTDSAHAFSLQSSQSEADILKLEANLVNLGRVTLASLGPAGAQKSVEDLTQGLINMSSATAKPLAGLMRIAPLVFTMPDRAAAALQRLGGLTEEQAFKIEDLAKAGQTEAATQELINDLFAAFPQAAAKTSTPLKDLENRFNQLENDIGQKLMVVVKAFDEIVTHLPTPLVAAAVAVGVLLGTMTLFNLVFGKAKELLGGPFNAAVKAITLGQVDLAAKTAASTAVQEGATAATEAQTAAVVEETAAVEASNVAWTEQLAVLNAVAVENTASVFERIGASISGAVAKLRTFLNTIPLWAATAAGSC